MQKAWNSWRRPWPQHPTPPWRNLSASCVGRESSPLAARHSGAHCNGCGSREKKKALHASERDSPRVRRLRREHREAMRTISPENLVFVDESGANLSFCRWWARSARGLRAFGSAPQNWGDNITIPSALTVQGTLASMQVPGSTDGEVFLSHVQKVLAPCLWPGALVLLDNLSAHKVAGVQDAIEETGARLRYLPPYSPELNPIEQAWSKLKSHLRKRAARTCPILSRAIATGLELITPADARGFFSHCGFHG